MANPEHLAKLKEGVEVWNKWREKNPQACPDLSGVELNDANLSGMDLSKTDLRYATLNRAGLTDANLYKALLNNGNLNGTCLDRANLIQARVSGAQLWEATLIEANLTEADLSCTTLIKASLTKAKVYRANLSGAIMDGATITEAYLYGAQLRDAYLHGTNLQGSQLTEADLSHAKLHGTELSRACLRGANLTGAQLWGTKLIEADLTQADLTDADLTGADLTGASLCKADVVRTSLRGAILSHCHVYGISIWDADLERAIQSNLVITPEDQPQIQVDNLQVAQFIYLLLNRHELRNVITTLGEKAVLILGRFMERKELLDRIADRLRSLGYLPMIFDFDRPTDRDLTETVKILAGLSRFVIADITNPRSVPLELQATIPDYMVPFVTILQRGQPAFGMFDDLPRKYHWALPLLEYNTGDTLLATFEQKVVNPALEKAQEVRIQKATAPVRRSAED